MSKLLQMLKLIRPYWRHLAQALCIGVLVMLFQIPGPYITKIIIDNAFPHKNYTLLVCVLGAATCVGIGLSVVRLMSTYFSTYVGSHMSFDMQSNFFLHIQSLDFSFFDQRQTGEVISRFRDMRSSMVSSVDMLNTLIMNSLQLLIFPPILFLINWKLALISMCVLPFDTLIVLISRKILARYSKSIAEESAVLSARMYESFSGIRTIQALSMESPVFNRIKNTYWTLADLRLKSSLAQGGATFTAALFRITSTTAYGWYGWTQVFEQNLTLGGYMAFTSYVGFLYGPIRNLIGLIGQFETSMVRINRFFEIYDLKPTVREDSTKPLLPRIQGNITFNDVSFHYEGSQPVLQTINFHIPAGKCVALVGRSGAGKSTVAKLIPRFYDPTCGSVSIDNNNIRDFRLSSLREQVGFAMQNSTLFEGTIRENLVAGKDIPIREIEGAAKTACIHDYINTLAEGYDTQIGEAGAKMSEGQKQRLALARVLLLNAPILILDEPTSALDMESELLVQKALRSAKEGRTTIIIAHRLATIMDADEIFVIDSGQVAERGNHRELLMNKGIYNTLFASMARI